jgi:hypothetical protein
VPADAEHRYDHHKIENLSAAIEGILILVGSGVIAFEAIRKGGPKAGRSRSSGSAPWSWRFPARPTSASPPTVPPGPRHRVTGARRRRRPPAHRRHDLVRRPHRRRAGADHRRHLARGSTPRWRCWSRSRSCTAACASSRARAARSSTRPCPQTSSRPSATPSSPSAPRAWRATTTCAPLGGLTPLRRPARPVPRRHHPRGAARHRPRAAGRHRAPAPQCRRPHPPRARGPRPSWSGSPERATVLQRRLIAAAAPMATNTTA